MTAANTGAELATPQEVAAYRRTTVGQLSNERYQGTGPDYVKLGRRIYYYWEDVYAHVQANKVRLSAPPSARCG